MPQYTQESSVSQGAVRRCSALPEAPEKQLPNACRACGVKAILKYIPEHNRKDTSRAGISFAVETETRKHPYTPFEPRVIRKSIDRRRFDKREIAWLNEDLI